MGALRNLKYMLEEPSKDTRIADLLHGLLSLKRNDQSDLVILEKANLVQSSTEPPKQRLRISNLSGEHGRRI